MPSLPYAGPEAPAGTKLSTSASSMIGASAANETCPTSSSSVSPSGVSCAANSALGVAGVSEKPDHQNKNQRNRAHAKIKLLVRSHAMRESTSPPREPNGLQPQDVEKISGTVLPPNSNRPKQLNNNEHMQDSNISTVGVDPPKKTIETPISEPNENGQHLPLESSSSKNPTPTIEDSEMSPRSPIEHANCSSCGLNSSLGLLQTPAQQILPSKASHGLQHSPKSTNLAQQMHNNENNSGGGGAGGGGDTKTNNSASPSSSFVCNVPCSNQCGNSNNANNNNNNNTLSISRSGSRHKLRHRNASQGSFDATSPSISRDSSTELYTDSTGIDLEQFIGDTLNRNQKDRTVLLRIERELVDFARDRQRVCHKFPNMSSYNRMLVHRVAAYFGMEHNVDQTGLCVVVTRTKNTRIPDTRFKESIRDDIVLTEEPKRSILKRDSNSFEDNFNFKSPDRFISDYCRRSKSFEEREEEYERARRRIFKDNSGDSAEATSWPWSSAESSDTPSKPRMSHALVSEHGNRQPMLLKVESFHEPESLRRPSVPKSYSFGGYAAGGMLSRDNSITSMRSAGARLTKQDSGTSTCSRLSPSSSGYKSQSQRSDTTISPSPSPSPVMPTGRSSSRVSSRDLVSSSPEGNGQQTVIWAVTNISNVPLGSVIINPRTNLPYKNSDGTIYRFDPENPPKSPPERESERREKRTAGVAGETETRNFNPSLKSGELHKRRSRYEKNNQEAAHFANSSTSPNLPFETSTTPTVVSQAQQQQLQQTLVKNCTTNAYSQAQQVPNQNQHASYVSPNSQINNQGVYFMHARPSSAITISPYPPSSAQQIRIDSSCAAQPVDRPEILCCGQNPMIASYQIPAVQGAAPVQTFEEVADLSGAFVGMNFYDQRAAGDAQAQALAMAPQAYQHSQQTSSHPLHRIQPGPNTCWQTHPSQIPVQQAMYFLPPSPAGIINGQNPVEGRQHIQRFATAYSFNHPGGITPTNPPTPGYPGGYPAQTIPTMQGIHGMQSPQGEFAYQPGTHVIPAYYNPTPSAASMQPAPVMYGVPTPPNTPTNSQMSAGIPPLMYVNSNAYGPSALITGGTFGHPVSTGMGQSASQYVGAALVPNVMLRQAVPAITGMRASTPSSIRRASRSPDASHDIFAASGRDRNAQAQYQIPMCQGVHIVQGLAGNPRLQYAPAPSPLSTTAQGCSRPYRPPSYAINTSTETSRNSVDNRNQKLRKHR